MGWALLFQLIILITILAILLLVVINAVVDNLYQARQQMGAHQANNYRTVQIKK
jgi:hypothetical protein